MKMNVLSTIRSKLIFMGVALVILPCLILSAYSYNKIKKDFREDIGEVLNFTRHSYSGAIEGLKTKGLHYGEFLGNDASIREAVSYTLMTDDNSNLIGVLEKIYKALDLNNVEFTAKNAVVLARGHEPKKFNDSKRGFPFTERMIKEQKKGWDYEIGKSGVTMKFGVPVFVEKEFAGFVGYGYYIDEKFLNSVKQTVNADLVFVLKQGEKSVASTNTQLSAESMNRELLRKSLEGQEGADLEEKIGSMFYSTAYLPVLTHRNRCSAPSVSSKISPPR